jgi:HK97 family phage major capsid protein
MSPDWIGQRGDGPDGDEPPDGAADARPYGSRPYGSRPYGSRPYGSRPYGSRPYGSRPYGSRPYGSRPYGSRPYGSRDDEDQGAAFIDPDEWSSDIADLFCEGSALIRLGARLITDGDDLAVPAIDFSPWGARGAYIQQPEETAKDATYGTRINTRLKPEAQLSQRRLRPRDHELAATVVIPNRLVRDVIGTPDLAWALKEDIAHELVVQADGAFLQGTGGRMPLGIVANAAVAQQPGVPVGGPLDLLATARAMIAALRRGRALFRHPGWVLSPDALADLTDLRTADGLGMGAPPDRALDARRLLSNDGVDGGQFLGSPFIATGAAGPRARLFLSSDWREAWIATDGEVLTIEISADTRFRSDETVVRATMRHDFVVRKPTWFRHT